MNFPPKTAIIITSSKGGTIASSTTISPFWYRRISEITLIVSFILMGLFGVGWVLGEGFIGATIFVPLPAAIMALVTAIVSLVSYIWAPRHLLWAWALACYLSLSATVAVVTIMTGDTASPFLALWMVVAIFAGLFGLYAFAPLFLATQAYLIYQFFFLPGGLTKEQLVLFILAAELPLAVGYVIWHTKVAHENEKDKAFDALARELGEVAGTSEIVINAIADGVLALDPRGSVQLINPAAQTILGWGKSDAIGLDYHSIMKLTDKAGKDLTPETDPVQHVLRTGTSVVNNDLTLTTASGKQLLLSLLISPVNSTPGSGAIAVFRDITAEKAEERQQAEFISTASHEMRTPVASIEGYLGLALNPATATIDDKARAYLTKAHEAAEHLGRLFQDLLDVSKAEDGRLKNNPTVIDVVSFVRDVAAGQAVKAQAKGLFLYFKPGAAGSDSTRRVTPVFYTKVDSDHLSEVVGNLLENAIKYTKQGSVTLDILGDEEHVKVTVRDTGIGIPREDIPHLFQKFYRVDNGATREIGGTGLGLYLCRRLAEAMGGRVTVDSELGKGSTFTLELPRLSHEDAMHELEQAAAPPPQIIPNPQQIITSQGTPPPQA